MNFVIKRPMQNEWERENCFNTRCFCLFNVFKPYEIFSCKRRRRYNVRGNAPNFDQYWALITIEQIRSSSLPRPFLTPFSWQFKCHLIDWLFSVLAISDIFQQYNFRRILCPSLSSSYVYIFFSLMRTWPTYPLFLYVIYICITYTYVKYILTKRYNYELHIHRKFASIVKTYILGGSIFWWLIKVIL